MWHHVITVVYTYVVCTMYYIVGQFSNHLSKNYMLAYSCIRLCWRSVIDQPQICRPANPEVRGSNATCGLNLSLSQRLWTGLLLGSEIRSNVVMRAVHTTEYQNNATRFTRCSLNHRILLFSLCGHYRTIATLEIVNKLS